MKILSLLRLKQHKKGKSLLLLALFFFSMTQVQAFQTKLDSLIDLLYNADNDSAKVSYMNKIAFGLSTREPDTALNYVNRSLKLAQKKELKKGEADAYHVKGILLSNMNMPLQAIENYKIALKLRKEIHDMKGVSATLTNLGTAYLKNKQIDLAINQYKSSLKVDHQLQDTIGTATDYNNLGFSYWQKEDYDSARYFFVKALDIYSDIAYLSKMASTYSNIGGSYFYQNKMKEALHFFDEAYETYKSVDSYNGMAIALSNKAQILEKMGDYKQALVKRKGVVFLREKLKDPSQLAQANLKLGKNYEQQKMWKPAIKPMQRAFKLSDSLALPLLKMQAAFSIYNLYDSLKNKRKAKFYLTIYRHLEDSLKSIHSKDSLKHNNIQTGFEENIEKTKETKEKQLKQSNSIDKYKYYVWGEGILVLLLLGFVVYLILKNKQRNK